MSVPTPLWENLRDCFCQDDGSLPSIEITNLSPAGVSAIYKLLRKRSRLAMDESPLFWSRTREASVPVDSVPDAAELVAIGQAEAFHLCIAGVNAAGVELPALGIFVWPDCMELDYRMGPEWEPAQIAGFFELLKDCCALDSGAVIVPAKFEGPPNPALFAHAWAEYMER